MTANAKINQGVYFLANDRIVDLVIVFLNSFRKHNPSTPLCLIPFNWDIHQLKQLQARYKFSIYSNARDLERCDVISRSFSGKVTGRYRKLVAWQGDFDEFIYIDVDTVVLGSIDFVFEYLSHYDFITAKSNISWDKQWVWKNSIDAAGRLTPQQIAYSANTGFIASKKRALDLEIIENKLKDAVNLSPHMEMRYDDQPLINYLIVTSEKPYTSLNVLYYQEGDAQGIKLELWAGTKELKVSNGKIDTQGKHPPVLFVHWAGKWQPKFLDRIIFYSLKLVGFNKKTDQLVIRFFMPYKKLWEYYRA